VKLSETPVGRVVVVLAMILSPQINC